MGLGIVVGADTAGYDCGETLTEGFGVDEHVIVILREVTRRGLWRVVLSPKHRGDEIPPPKHLIHQHLEDWRLYTSDAADDLQC